MKRSAIAGVGLLCAGVLVWFVLQNRDRGDRPELSLNADSSDASLDRIQSSTESSQISRTTTAVNPPSSRRGIQVGDPMYTTQADADWLNRNFFPSTEDMRGVGEFSSLSEMTFSGSPTPQKLASAETAAMTRPDLVESAQRYLNHAAVSGSLFALEALARIHGHPSNPNYIASEAYYRAAEMRGNWTLAARDPRALPTEQQVVARLMAHQIISNIESERNRRGLPPLRPDYRPGLSQAMSAIRERSQKLRHEAAIKGEGN